MSPTNSSKKNVCIIDLERVYENLPNQNWSERDFNGQHHSPNPLHQDLATELTLKVWNALSDNTKAAAGNWHNGWTNLNYFISGGRGSGKSTFLRYVSRCITGKEELPHLGDKREQHQIERRPIVHDLFFCDPTAMTSRENFLVSIIAAIHDLVKYHTGFHTRKTSYMFPDGAHHHENGREVNHGAHTHQFFMSTPGSSNNEILDKISNLSRGITLLEETYSSNSQGELDPESQLQLGILNSNKALHLKRHFDEIIDLIARTYEVDGLLICIDDADIECTKNKQIFENIRTYLTHPRIIILFTGDQLLTHETIRQKQFEHFSLDFHNEDIANKTRRLELTDDMAAQYLKKIFPVSNNISLYSLYEAVLSDNTYELKFTTPYFVKREDNSHPPVYKRELTDFVKTVFSNTLTHSSTPATEDTDVFLEGFLRLPLRSILLTLRHWNDKKVHVKLEELKTLDEEGKEKESRELRRELADILAVSFRTANYNELLSKGFTRTELDHNSIYALSMGILRHCINSGNLIYGYHLATSATRFSNQESALMLAAKAAGLLESYGDCFTFALFSAFTAKVFKHYLQNTLTTEGRTYSITYNPSRSSQYSQFVQNRFCEYLFSHNSANPIRWAKKISLICIANQNEQTKGYIDKGVFHLAHEADAELISLIFQDLASDISTKASDKYNSFLAYITLVILCGQTNGPHNTYYLSAFNMMGYMAHCYTLLSAYEGEEQRAKAVDMLKKTIERFIQTNVEPSWSNSTKTPPSNMHISKHLPSAEALSSLVGILAEKICDWVNDLKKKSILSAPEVGRVADVLYQSICDISIELSAHINSRHTLEEELPNNFQKLLPRLEMFFERKERETISTENEHAMTFMQTLATFPILQRRIPVIKLIREKVTPQWDRVERSNTKLKEIKDLYKSVRELPEKIKNTRRRLQYYFLPKHMIETEIQDDNIGNLYEIENNEATYKACIHTDAHLASLHESAESIEADLKDILKEIPKIATDDQHLSAVDIQESAAIIQGHLERAKPQIENLRGNIARRLQQKITEFADRQRTYLQTQEDLYVNVLAELQTHSFYFGTLDAKAIPLENTYATTNEFIAFYQDIQRARMDLIDFTNHTAGQATKIRNCEPMHKLLQHLRTESGSTPANEQPDESFNELSRSIEQTRLRLKPLQFDVAEALENSPADLPHTNARRSLRKIASDIALLMHDTTKREVDIFKEKLARGECERDALTDDIKAEKKKLSDFYNIISRPKPSKKGLRASELNFSATFGLEKAYKEAMSLWDSL